MTLVLNETSTHIMVFNCTSSESAATHVTWLKDGIQLTSSGFEMVQYIKKRNTSTYENLLKIPLLNLTSGSYTCNVSNQVGHSHDELNISKLQ